MIRISRGKSLIIRRYPMKIVLQVRIFLAQSDGMGANSMRSSINRFIAFRADISVVALCGGYKVTTTAIVNASYEICDEMFYYSIPDRAGPYIEDRQRGTVREEYRNSFVVCPCSQP